LSNKDIPAIEAAGISKRFRLSSFPKRAGIKDLVLGTIARDQRTSDVAALDDVSFAAERGTTLGIVGRNGSGKSTLLRILAGIVRPDSGSVRMHGSVAPLLALGAGFHPDLTGREGARVELLSLGLTRAQTAYAMDEVAGFSEIGDFIDRPVRTYSSGMLMRLAFAVAVSVDPDILLLDEILAVGDEAFSQKCLQRLDAFKRAGKTIVLVTHASGIVRAWCDQALWLDRGRVAAYGAPDEVIDAYHAATDVNEESPTPSRGVRSFSFTCNACGITTRLGKDDDLSGETGRCAACGSFVRLRAVIHLLSKHLFGRSTPIPDWPDAGSSRILGVNEAPFFASIFADKAAYANKRLGSLSRENADVAICCDALARVRPPLQSAFDELFAALRPGGLLALAMPYTFNDTIEHAPDPDERDPQAHARIFGLSDVKRRLREAGFVDVRVFDEDHLEFGIAFPVSWSLPITARRPAEIVSP
jgi:ABC-type polysaccharide/polyol phosphate transport system ATPase subunit/SAM-dependent methyltransferase